MRGVCGVCEECLMCEGCVCGVCEECLCVRVNGIYVCEIYSSGQ